MVSKFTLHLHNQTPIACQLAWCRCRVPGDNPFVPNSNTIKDDNGNSVGHWRKEDHRDA